jgi:hypothetical protein
MGEIDVDVGESPVSVMFGVLHSAFLVIARSFVIYRRITRNRRAPRPKSGTVDAFIQVPCIIGGFTSSDERMDDV